MAEQAIQAYDSSWHEFQRAERMLELYVALSSGMLIVMSSIADGIEM